MLNVQSVRVDVIIEEVEQYTIELFDKPHTISDINNLSIESILSLAEDLHISEAETTYSSKYYQYEYWLLNIKSNYGYIVRWRINTTLLGRIHGSQVKIP